MKKNPFIIFLAILCTFSVSTNAENNDTNSIITEQIISSTPNSIGEYEVSLGVYVEGKTVTQNIEAVYDKIGKSISVCNLFGYENKDGWKAFAEEKYKEHKCSLNVSIGTAISGTKVWYEIYDVKCTDKYYSLYWLRSGSDNYFIYDSGGTGQSRYKGALSTQNSCSGTTQSPITFSIDLYRLVTPASSQNVWTPKYDALGTQAAISETLDGFVIPNNTACIIQTAEFDSNMSGNFKIAADDNDAASVNISQDRKTVTISGFNFSDNSCGNDETGNHGKKLIVKFPVVTEVSQKTAGSKCVVKSSTIKNNSQSSTNRTLPLVNVNLFNLTIGVSATGIQDTDNFLFTVKRISSDWQPTFMIMIKGTDILAGQTTKQLFALPEGKYTITPMSWPLNYTAPNGQTITFSSTEYNKTAVFNFSSKTISPKHGEASASTPAN